MTVDRFSEPKGFIWGSFTNADAGQVRTGRSDPAGPSRGTIVLLQGFRECIEKYFELIRDFNSRGFTVVTMDWYGQGGSERLLKGDPQKAHGQDYSHNIADLHQFLSTLSTTEPLILAAHSMGAHLGLRYMAEHPGVFSCAVMSSPMLDINTAALPKALARQIARLAESSGAGAKYVPGGSDWNPGKEKFEKNNRTSDLARYENAQNILLQKPHLQLGDPTYAWIHHTFQSIDILAAADYLKKITTPVLMEVSRNDKIVERSAQDRAAPLMGNCRMVDIPDARHEIWMERDELRQVWLLEVDRFIAPFVKRSADLNPPSPHA